MSEQLWENETRASPRTLDNVSYKFGKLRIKKEETFLFDEYWCEHSVLLSFFQFGGNINKFNEFIKLNNYLAWVFLREFASQLFYFIKKG